MFFVYLEFQGVGRGLVHKRDQPDRSKPASDPLGALMHKLETGEAGTREKNVCQNAGNVS